MSPARIIDTPEKWDRHCLQNGTPYWTARTSAVDERYRFAELQTKAILFALMPRYWWSVPTGYTLPEQQAPIAKPTDGLPITLAGLT